MLKKNVFKKVGKLSGGEKVRLKLFELIQQRVINIENEKFQQYLGNYDYFK